MTTASYKGSIADKIYAEHKAIMEEAARAEYDAMMKREVIMPNQQFTGNRHERRKQAAKARGK